MTEIRINRFDGLSSYSYDPSASTMTVTIVDYTDDFYAALAADSTWRITLFQSGNGSGAGSAWCVHAPLARLIETPARADVDMVHGTTLKFQLCEPSDATPAANENLEMSRLLIALA